MNYYKRHLGDYAKDTKTLSVYEHGVYTVLLDYYYSTEAPLTADDIEGLCKPSTPKEHASVEKVLVKYFKRDGEVWRHNYADRVIAKAVEKSWKASDSASKRWAKDMRTHSEGNANASETHSEGACLGNASHKPLATSQEKARSKDGAAAPAEVDPDKAMWDLGVSVLGSGGRPLLGKLVRDHGKPAVMAAIAATVSARPVDAKPFLIGCLAKRDDVDAERAEMFRRAI